MIVTLTPNPSLDRTLEVDRLCPGRVHRAAAAYVEPSGKGVNITRALTRAGITTVAVLPVGGHTGAYLADLLRAERVRYEGVPVAGAVRVNVSTVTADGQVTKVNEPGPRTSSEEVRALLASFGTALAGATWAVGSGSLPPGAPVDLYADACRRAHETGVPFALDSSGPPLRHGVAAGPDLVKPNLPELAELVGRPLRSLGDVVDAAAEVRRASGAVVLVSLGGAGAVLAGDGDPRHAWVPRVRVRSSVGAGDSLLAGYLAGCLRATDRDERLRAAVAWGTAAARARGSLGAPVTDGGRRAVRVGGVERSWTLSAEEGEDADARRR